MKLKNKKTGEIIETVIVDHGAEWEIRNMYTDEDTQTYNSLAELNEEWEDYEEPKDFWFIDPEILIACESTDPLLCDKKVAIETMKQIGNYFDSREEAEKAVEKLKAWKRLKDNGYKFNGIGVDYDAYKIRLECNIMKKEHYTPTQDHKDLDLLFGGEE